MFPVSFPHLSDFKMPNSISETQTNKTDLFPLTSTVNILQPSIHRPGQVVKLSTSGRLAALPRVASHCGWLVFVCVLLSGWDKEAKRFG